MDTACQVPGANKPNDHRVSYQHVEWTCSEEERRSLQAHLRDSRTSAPKALSVGQADHRSQPECSTCFSSWFCHCATVYSVVLCFRNPYDLGWSRNFQEVQSGVTRDCSVSWLFCFCLETLLLQLPSRL